MRRRRAALLAGQNHPNELGALTSPRNAVNASMLVVLQLPSTELPRTRNAGD